MANKPISLYNLISEKCYKKSENICELVLAIIDLKKITSFFYQKYPEKLIALFSSLNLTSFILKSFIWLEIIQLAAIKVIK